MEGRVSWFGGPNDPSAGTRTASNAPISEPGIAVYNHGTLGGYWRVTASNGKTAILRQTDIGPAPWTGRKVDVTYSALGQLGYNEHNFPTDSKVKAEYLGHTLPRGTRTGPTHMAGIPSQVPTQKTITEQLTGSIPTFNRQAYEEAAQHQRGVRGVASLFTGGGEGDALLREALQRAGKAPQASEFGGSRVVNMGTRSVLMPSNSSAPNSLANAVPHGSKLAGFLPGNAALEIKRKDQGQDIKTNPGGAILAPGNGRVLLVQSNPGGFGTAYPVVHFDTGPLAGHDVYIGHTRAALSPGQHFKEGQVLSHTGNGTGPYVGNATGLPGWAEIGLWTSSGPIRGAETGGRSIAPLLGLR